MNKLSTALATATFAALPMMASAVTVNTDVSIGDAPSVSYSIPASGDGVTFSFTALENFSIDGFSITANGSNSGSDILASTYSVLGGTPLNFTNVFAVGAQGIGFAFASGAVFAAGDIFTVVFAENSPRPVSYAVSFTASAVPVPAAGLLLLTALGGAAAMRRRKKATNA
jgi:hypothetical protein|tara:strand:+ start:6686 stop:7195 length:510 start_codon:yes stop_codon:yes gene_type:complete